MTDQAGDAKPEGDDQQQSGQGIQLSPPRSFATAAARQVSLRSLYRLEHKIVTIHGHILAAAEIKDFKWESSQIRLANPRWIRSDSKEFRSTSTNDFPTMAVSMNIFVTGGTGLLGNTILRQLSAEGESLLSLVRGEPDSRVFAGIETDFVHGDLADVDAIEKAVQWADAVIHSAGLIHLGWRRREESYRVNRDGTATIVDACLKYQRKLVHVGAVNCLAVGSVDQIADEATPLDHAGGQVPCSYVDSKRAGLAEVRRGVGEGLDAIMVHPGFMLGPWDWKPSSGRMMVEVARSWKPLAPSGGCSLCDSRDVAAASIQSLRANLKSGREYILAGHNLMYLDLWQRMAEHMQARKPIMRAGPLQLMLASGAGDLWSGLASRFGGQESDINSAAVRMSRQIHWYDSSRAQAELGYQFRDADSTLSDAAAWLRGDAGASRVGG